VARVGDPGVVIEPGGTHVDPENLPLRAFVLGRLPEQEAAPIAASAQSDVELADAIRAIEAELFDELVAGRLDAEERAAFDARFGADPDTPRRLASARAFARLVDRHAQGGLEALIEHAVTTSGAYARTPLPTTSSAADANAAPSRSANGTSALGEIGPPTPAPPSVAPASPIEPEPALIPHFSSSRTGSGSPLAPLPALPIPPPAPVTPLRRVARAWSALAVVVAAGLGFGLVRPTDATVALRLEPAGLRAAADAPEVRLGQAALALELALDPPRAPGRYTVRIVESRGAEVWRADARPGEALRVRVSVPAGTLAPGAYVVHLTEGAYARTYPLEVVGAE
jgi:hypothetical protein